MLDFINSHLTAIDSIVIGYIISALVQALPVPTDSENKLYLFFYKFCHLMVANWKVTAKKLKEESKDDGTSGI